MPRHSIANNGTRAMVAGNATPRQRASGLAGWLSALLAAVIAITVSGAGLAHALSLDEYFTYSYSMELSHEEVAVEEAFTATISGQATCTKNLPVSPSKAEFTSRAIGRHTVSGVEVVLNDSFMLTVSPFPSLAGESAEGAVAVPMSFPPDGEPGTYTIIGELILARVRVGFWVDVTSELPSTQVLGTILLSEPEPEFLWIAVTPEDASVAAGLTQQFTATGTYSDASSTDITNLASWASSDPMTATIDAAGLAAAVAEGSTTITATLGTISDSTTLTATAPELVAIAVTPEDASATAGLTRQFTATGTYTDDSTDDITNLVAWASSDPTRATIDATGLARAFAGGTTTITATLGTISGHAILTIDASENPGNASENPGNGGEEPADGEDQTPPPDVPPARAEYISEDGQFTRDVTTSADDGHLSLGIEQGTTGSDVGGEPVKGITIDAVETPRAKAGREVKVIGTAYDLGPDGATFDRPLVMTLVYDESLVPDRLTERQLAAAFWKSGTEEWVPLPSEVDTVNNRVTTLVDHFTIFAVVAPVRPAAFTLSGLTSTPAEIAPGESVTASVVVTNSGDLEGDYPVMIRVNGAHEETRLVTLPGGASQTIAFSVSPSDPGTYTVETGALTTTFAVKKPTPPSTEPATPDADTPVPEVEEPQAQAQAPATEPTPSGVSGLLVGIPAGLAALAMAVAGVIWWRRARHQTGQGAPLTGDTFTKGEGD